MTLKKEEMTNRKYYLFNDEEPFFSCINHHAVEEAGWTSKDQEGDFLVGQECPICGEKLRFFNVEV